MEKTPIIRDLIIDPPIDELKIDASSILSLSIHDKEIVLITQDCIAKVYGDNSEGLLSVSLPLKNFEEFTQFDIKDQNGDTWYPLSATIGLASTLYMVSKVEKGYKKC